MTNTNDFGQPVNSKGRTLRQREVIAEDIDALFTEAVQEWIDQGRDPEHIYAIQNFMTGRAIGLKKALADYMLTYTNTEWQKNVANGIALGRADVVTMLKAAVPAWADLPASTTDMEGFRQACALFEQNIAAIITAVEGEAK